MTKMANNAYVSAIINEWYDAMGENNISVQPKATTLLNSILMKYQIKSNPKDNSEILK